MNRSPGPIARSLLHSLGTLSILTSCLSAAPTAPAAVVSGVTIEAVSSELDPAASPYPWDEKAAYVVDGSGLDSAGLHGDNSYRTMWAANTFVPSQTNGATDTAPFIVFDLGAVYALHSMAVWNYNGRDAQFNYSGRSIHTAFLSISTDGNYYAGIGLYGFPAAPGTSGYAGQEGPFNYTARYVRFDIRTNYANDLAYGVGLSEIRFSAVPLPPAIALFGLGLAGLAGRSRRIVGRRSDSRNGTLE